MCTTPKSECSGPSPCLLPFERRRVPLQYRPQGRLQRLQPGRITTPVIHGIVVDRLAHLLRTRRAYGPAVIEEPQAARFKFQAAIIQDAAYLGFGVHDQAFVLDTANPPGQHGIEVRHEFGIIPVVTPDVVEAVAEILPTRKMLLED